MKTLSLLMSWIALAIAIQSLLTVDKIAIFAQLLHGRPHSHLALRFSIWSESNGSVFGCCVCGVPFISY